MKYEPTETNPQAEWKSRRKYVLSCSYCPPHRAENKGRGTTKAKRIRKKIEINKLPID